MIGLLSPRRTFVIEWKEFIIFIYGVFEPFKVEVLL